MGMVCLLLFCEHVYLTYVLTRLPFFQLYMIFFLNVYLRHVSLNYIWHVTMYVILFLLSSGRSVPCSTDLGSE